MQSECLINDHFWKICELRFLSLQLPREQAHNGHVQSEIIRKS